MHNWQRPFTYITGALVIGLLLIVFTNGLLQYVNAQGYVGYISLFAFGLVYLNLGYAVNRRFALKSQTSAAVNYIMTFLLVAPTLLWIFTKDEGLGDSLLVFALTIVFAAGLGTYFGIKGGIARRETYLRSIYEGRSDLPDELKRTHDDLNKN